MYSRSLSHYGLDPAAAAGNQYSVKFVNNSTNPGNVCIYQEDPNLGVPNVMSLAWFSKYAYPETIITFRWTIDYSFVWAETGTLQAGVVFDAAQIIPAELTNLNQISLTYRNGYDFVGLGKGPQPGTLYINEDSTVPLKMASVGIAMSGAGTFAVQAQPNMKLTFTPHPKYWITFGDFVEGQVLDIGQITDKALLDFKPNIFGLTATLNIDNTWTVTSTARMNAQFLARLEQQNPRSPEARPNQQSAQLPEARSNQQNAQLLDSRSSQRKLGWGRSDNSR